MSRNWHALNTQYNILYNGNIAFEQGRAILNSGYRDDYWDLLPVERLQVTDAIRLDSEGNTPNFVLAEEKATKAIQKHSMNIKNRERNPQTDEAFLLLGKARYFDQRYIPALEAFTYILKKYVKSDKVNEATIWREKTNMRLEHPELAIKNLERLLALGALKNQEYADAYAVLAQCYIQLKAPDIAIQKLQQAQAYTKKNTEKGRYRFIIGQLYDQLGYKDSANYAYDQVIALKRKSPRVYLIHAHIRKIQNTPLTDAHREATLEALTHLEKNWENRLFLDRIYREMAQLYAAAEADSVTAVYYNKSLRATQGDRKLNALNYQSLADSYFDKKAYKTAGQYYDSTLTQLQANTKMHRSITKKLSNLEDVIRYENLVQYADSVISLYHMPEAERRAYFEEYITELKRKDKAAAVREPALSGFVPGAKPQGTFYFYNRVSLEYGKNSFKARWGKRELKDDWRWSATVNVLQVGAPIRAIAAEDDASQNTERNPRYSPDFYLSQIPTKASKIDSLSADRNLANYQLGLIYKEKFKDYPLAAAKLEGVLASRPEPNLVLPVKYNLYKIYKATQNPLARDMKQDIITQHPNTRYAEILANPEAMLEKSADSPDARYAALYKLYEQEQFQQVLTQAKAYSNTFTGDPIVPKFELLRAQAMGRLHGFKAFKKALNYVALTYPNDPEGKKAAQLLEEELPKWENQEFATEPAVSGTSNWKVVFPFTTEDDEKALRLKEHLEAAIEELHYKNKVSKDVYTTEEQFVVVHGFPSKEFALGFSELIKNNIDYRINDENFVVLSNNYEIIQIHKNAALYIKQILTPKP